MLRRIGERFRRSRLQAVPLEFTLDLDPQGCHVVQVYMTLDGERVQRPDVANLWSYGYVVERESGRYVVDPASLETLLALRSLNPQIDADRTMVFEVCPPVLRYLRTHSQLRETPRAQRLCVHDQPLDAVSSVDYDPAKGLTVTAGYSEPGSDEVVPQTQIKSTADGQYYRIGDAFYPIGGGLGARVKEWLERVRTTIAPDHIPEFFKRDLVLLQSEMGVVLTDRAQSIHIVESRLQPRVRVDTGATGWLSFQIDYVAGEYELPADLIRKANQPYIQIDANTWIRRDISAVESTDKWLEGIGAETTPGGYRLPAMRVQSLEESIQGIGGAREVSAQYARFLQEITDFKADPSFALPADMESMLAASGIALRPYQRAGIHWLRWLSTHQLHGVLADDMGLGKTIQTIVTMALAYREKDVTQHSLVVCPKSVVRFWTREIGRCIPRARTYEYVGPGRSMAAWKRSTPTVFVSTYDTIARDIDVVEEVPLLFLVLDEATRIKNPDAKRTVAAKSLSAVHRIALSGTPIENRPAELWSMYDFLMRGHLGKRGTFTRLFEEPITDGDDAAAKRLGARIRPFLLRRLKTEVAKDLPEKINMDEWCELTAEQKSLYGQIQEQYGAPVRDAIGRGTAINYAASVLPVLTKLKQVCDHPAIITGQVHPVQGRSEKFDMVLDKLQEIVADGERAVVFTHFLSTLDLLEIALRECGLSWLRLDGSTVNRQSLIDKFNEGGVQAALCSLQAIGHGVSMTAANHVIHVDRWWNPAVEDQATDRVHRIGQQKTVYVHRILTLGTLEEKIADMLERKRDISDRVIGAATGQQMQWSREELLELLKPLD